MCGVSVGYLSQIFAGKTVPGPDVAVRVAQALKATDREQARIRHYAEGTEADRAAQRTADATRPRRPGWEGCPYRGLLPFEEQHAPVFYGRRTLTGRLLDRLRGHPADAGILLVLGPSGAGKSSLLRAGLMGSLAADALTPGCQFWPRRVITPTSEPVRQLAIHLAELAGADALSVRETLTARPGQAHLLAGQALAASGGGRLVLVVDQLEELLTLTTDTTEQQGFLAALHSLATEPVLPGGLPGALIVAGIRADFLDQALVHPPVRHATEAGAFTVGAMSESELREAITGPAAEAGARVPDDLCTAILDDLREHNLPVGFDSGSLPLLSQVMFVMWQAGESAGLTVAGYHRTGGIADIVRTSAEQTYEALAPSHREAVRPVFLHLTATTGGRLTRRPSTRSALRVAVGSDATDVVVEAFAAQRLLTVSDNDTVTIAHEELLRSWNRLRDWLHPSLTDQILHQALTGDAHEWRQRRRDPSYLYQGARLLAVDDALRRWIADPAQHFAVDPETTDFLRAGHHRARRRRRAYRGVAASMVLLVVLAGIAAVRENRSAERARLSALQADRQRAVAVSRLLAGLSRDATDRVVSEQLAAAALAASPTRDALDAAGVLLRDHRRVLPAAFGVAAFSPGGTLATAGADRLVRMWNPWTGRLAGSPIAATSGVVMMLRFITDDDLLIVGDQGTQRWDTRTRRLLDWPFGAFDQATDFLSPDGTRLATVEADGTARLWDTRSGRQAGTVPALGGRSIRSIEFSATGGLLAVGGDDGTVRLWNWQAGGSVAPPMTGTATGAPVALGPDGDLVAIGGHDGTVRLWHTRTAKAAGRLKTGTVREIVFSPDGTRLATVGGAADSMRLWDPRTGRAIGGPLISNGRAPARPLFSRDGKLLVTADLLESAVRLWNPATAHPADELPGSTLPGQAVFSGDGTQVVLAESAGTGTVWTLGGPPVAGVPLPGIAAVGRGPNGVLRAVTGLGGPLRLRDAWTGRPVGEFLPADIEQTDSMALSADGALLATAGGDGGVEIWDPQRGEKISGPVRGDDGQTAVIAFNQDGTLLATGGADGRVRLWNPRTGQLVHGPFKGSDYSVTEMFFTPDGDQLAVVNGPGRNATVWLWDPRTGKPIRGPVEAPDGMAPAINFSQNSELLAAVGGLDRPVRVWDLMTSTATAGPLAVDTPSFGAFSPDGGMLALNDHDSVRLWDLWQFRNPLTHLCDRAGTVSAATWNAHVPDEPLPQPCR
ncbi:hypothetical protein Ait01nite_079930 [Actinoplanes italicus]|nr:hypothetical protein Ait01nite_079930 [Actinoplanes italicus]